MPEASDKNRESIACCDSRHVYIKDKWIQTWINKQRNEYIYIYICRKYHEAFSLSLSPSAKVPKPDPTSPSPVSSVAKKRKPSRDTPAEWEGIVKKQFAGWIFVLLITEHITMNHRICIYIMYIQIVCKKPHENQFCFNNFTFFLLSEPHLWRPTWPASSRMKLLRAPSKRLVTSPTTIPWAWGWSNHCEHESHVVQVYLWISLVILLEAWFAILTMCQFVGATLLPILVHDCWCVKHTVQHLCISHGQQNVEMRHISDMKVSTKEKIMAPNRSDTTNTVDESVGESLF